MRMAATSLVFTDVSGVNLGAGSYTTGLSTDISSWSDGRQYSRAVTVSRLRFRSVAQPRPRRGRAKAAAIAADDAEDRADLAARQTGRIQPQQLA